MLDIKFIKENPDIVKAAIKDKNRDIDVDELLQLAEQRTEAKQALDALNREKNEAAALRDIERGKHIKESLEAADKKVADIEKKYVALMLKLPNVPSADTPVGADESGNKVVRQIGDKRDFDFDPKPHWEIGQSLGIIDTETAGKVSGARFTYLKGGAALLQYALFDLVLKTVTDEDVLKSIATRAGIDVSTKPFMPVVPPYMMRPAVMNRMARLDPIEDRFHFEKDDLILIGSAEHTLGTMHMDEVLSESTLPLRYFAYTPAFRREAGSYGKDTRGILRQHQFDKVEMETFTKAEDGIREQEFLVAIQEYLLQRLELPYQVVLVCTGDMGFPDTRQFDIETWMPGQQTYRETHSADYVAGFQPRRLNTRVKRADGTIEHVHMNDATAIAMGRTLIAILENYQEKDGSVKIPKVLQAYVGTDIIKKS